MRGQTTVIRKEDGNKSQTIEVKGPEMPLRAVKRTYNGYMKKKTCLYARHHAMKT
jgi:hypothetical protein